MDSHSNDPNTTYQSVTVDVPADRLAEFHAFFARFLAGRSGRGRRGRHGGRPHRGPQHHRRCAEHRRSGPAPRVRRVAGRIEPGEATGQSAEISEV